MDSDSVPLDDLREGEPYRVTYRVLFTDELETVSGRFVELRPSPRRKRLFVGFELSGGVRRWFSSRGVKRITHDVVATEPAPWD